MSNFFTFNEAVNEYVAGTWNPATSTHYLHLVLSLPNIAATTVSQLSLPTSSEYFPAPVSGTSFVNSVLNFNPVLFERYQGTEEVIGAVLVRQLGGSPAPTDRLLTYSRLRNAANAPLSFIPSSSERIRVEFPNGAVQFQNVFAYASGSWTGVWPLNDGILFLLGTENNTLPYSGSRVITQSNTGTPKILGIADGIVGGSSGSISFNNLDRGSPAHLGICGLTPANSLVLDFRSRRIRIGRFRWAAHSLASPAMLRLDGTNELPIFNPANAELDSNWTQLINVPSTSYAGNIWYEMIVNSTQYYRYIRLKMVSGSNITISEIDFFNSSILSSTANLTGT